jgi:hypothetical protein
MYYYCEQVTGIEPAYSVWKTDTLPLSYTCVASITSRCRRRKKLGITVNGAHLGDRRRVREVRDLQAQ